MSILEEWTAAVRADLGLDPGSLSTPETRTVLDLARDVAHAVDRPAAPLTAYLLGLAVGRGLTLPDAADRIRALAAGWAESTEPAAGPEALSPLTGRLRDRPSPGVLTRRSARVDARGHSTRTNEGWSMPETGPEMGPDMGRARSRRGESQPEPNLSRRGVLLGAVGLAGLGGTLAGCSTAAVPYDANEAGVPPGGPAPSALAMNPSAPASSPGATAGGGMQNSGTPKKEPAATGVVLGTAGEIPVGGGMVFSTARVVVTQPARGQYRAFSAVCTHVGCIMSKVANGTIDCPCHGSEFKIATGAVVTGPAPAPLPKKRIKIVNGMVVLL